MNRVILSLVLVMFIGFGCDPDLSDDAIPYQPFPEILIDLNLPSYAAIKTDGGSMYYGDGGVRGLILYRKDINTYFAWERNCSYHPNEATSTVDIDLSGLYMVDSSCGSTFSFTTGQPTGGIAWRPLRRYYATVSSNLLTITDQIIE